MPVTPATWEVEAAGSRVIGKDSKILSQKQKVWGLSSSAEHLPRKHKALDSISVWRTRETNLSEQEDLEVEATLGYTVVGHCLKKKKKKKQNKKISYLFLFAE
jgi:hypothetical protein